MPRRARGETDKVALVSFASGVPIKTLDFPPATSGTLMRWSRDSHSLFYIDRNQRGTNIWRLPLDGSPPKPVTDFKNEQIWSFDVSRDGKQFIIARGTINSDAVLISEVK